MTPRIAPTDEFVDLMCDLAEGRISPPQFDRLDELLCADPANCQNYVDFMGIVTRLAWIGDDGADGAVRMTGGQSPEVLAQWAVDRGHERPDPLLSPRCRDRTVACHARPFSDPPHHHLPWHGRLFLLGVAGVVFDRHGDYRHRALDLRRYARVRRRTADTGCGTVPLDREF